MLRATFAGLRVRKLRLAATAIAVILGVGFVAGTLLFGDTAKATMFDQLARSARDVDVLVTPPVSREADDARYLAAGTVPAVRAVAGVAAVAGRSRRPLPLLDKRGRLVGNAGTPGIGLSVGTDPRLRPFDLAKGRMPERPGEAALDVSAAGRARYAPGDRITVLDVAQRRHTLTLVGTVDFGAAKQYADQAVVVLVSEDLTTLAGTTGFQQVVVRAEPGVSEQRLAERIRAALPAGVRVRTGERYRLDLADESIKQVTPFLTVLLVFSAITCLVAAFVIYNTFTILMAQRIREIALLRCVGATRRQVFGSVLLESSAVGLVGSAGGIALAAAVAAGLLRIMGALNKTAVVSGHSLVLTATPVAAGLLVGVLVTVVSALIPAVRATRVAPVAALRVVPLGAIRSVRGRVALIALAVLAAVLGTLLTVAGSASQERAQRAIILVMAGGVINFLAVLAASPLFVGHLTGAVGLLPGRLLSRPLGRRLGPVLANPAKLATANARRAPGRVAATTAALMVGVGLMSAASVAVATTRATADAQLREQLPVDYLLSIGGPSSGARTNGIPPAVADRLRADPALGLVAQIRQRQATLGGTRLLLGATDPAGLAQLPKLKLSAGSYARFRTGTVILSVAARAAAGRKVGDRVRLDAGNGRVGEFTVAALAIGIPQSGDALLTWDDFGKLDPAGTDDLILVRAADGVSPADSRAAVSAVTDEFPLVVVGSIAEARAQLTNAVDTLIMIIAVLLGFALVIALVGIMNTLSLSVFERTRESATLRALGLTRAQLAGTLLTEALLMAVVGALVGGGFGVVYGWVTSRVMFTGFAPVMTIPVGQLLLFLAIAAVAGVLAAVLPARTAARASVVAAMAEG